MKGVELKVPINDRVTITIKRDTSHSEGLSVQIYDSSENASGRVYLKSSTIKRIATALDANADMLNMLFNDADTLKDSAK